MRLVIKEAIKKLIFTALIMALGTDVFAISLAGSDTTRIIPQNDVRRFLGVGPTTGTYKDSQRSIGLEGNAYEITFWHHRGSWNFTRSLGLSYYEMDGSEYYPASNDTTSIDYDRITLNGTLGFSFDLGLIDLHPQWMIGWGEGNFGYLNETNAGDQNVNITNTILVHGPQLLLHFDFSKNYFVGLKYADYNNVGDVNFKDDTGKIEQNRVVMLIFGYRVHRSYSVYSRNRSWHGGIIDWFGY